MEGFAGNVTTELRVVFLRLHVAGVEENGQPKRLERVEVLTPRVIIKLQLERQRAVVRQVKHLRYRVRHVCGFLRNDGNRSLFMNILICVEIGTVMHV